MISSRVVESKCGACFACVPRLEVTCGSCSQYHGISDDGSIVVKKLVQFPVGGVAIKELPCFFKMGAFYQGS